MSTDYNKKEVFPIKIIHRHPNANRQHERDRNRTEISDKRDQ